MIKIFFYVFFIFCCFAEILYGQYFGRNKISYEHFDFQTLVTDQFNIYYYPQEAEATQDAAKMLERWNKRFAKIFGTPITKGQPVVLYASHGHFQQTKVISGFVSQGTGGVTEGIKNRITLPFTGIYQENDHVLGHELVHAFQYELFKSLPGGLNSASQMPLWFIEGLAEYLSIGRNDAFTAMWMRDAVLNNDIPTIDDVSRGRYFPYRYGHALWSYIAGAWGDDIIAPLFRTVADSGWESAFRDVLGYTVDSVSSEWQNAVRTTYQPQIEGKTKPLEAGNVIRSKENSLNLSPVVSPDGRYISLITTEGLFTLDLFLIDARTGELITELASSNSDRHYDALRFINSSGSWSPDSKNFAFVVIEEGRDEIAIVDAETGKFKKEIKIDPVTEISHLAWSPDGNKFLVSGTSGGISDLYLYDLTNNSFEKLTNDKYADLQPDWAPDGKSIAFVTDRFKPTDLKELTFGSLKLAIMDLSTKKISPLVMAEQAKHLNPQYSTDGKNIYFISDPDGFSNIYRYNLASGQFSKITNVATGVSGLTENSPAISYAKQTGEIVFTVFNKGNYIVSSLNPEKLASATSSDFSTSAENIPFSVYASATALPPADKASQGIVEDYLADSANGLPENPNYHSEEYKSSLGLLYVGQIYAGAQVSSFATAIGGGVSFYFGDLLGDHFLGTALQINGSFKDIAGEVFYLNQSSRFNWGGGLAHLTYLTGFAYGGFDTVSIGGDLYLADKLNILRQRVFIDQASLLGIYPFSVNRRMEFSAGFTRYSYDYELETIVSVGSTIVSEETRSQDAPPALNLFQGSIAYVGDYSFFGFTSPVDGSRFRFEATPTLGSLNFVSLLADYRQYFFFNPVTIALRGLQYGRYFGDSEDPRLAPLQLGFETWIRGYNIYSFDPGECSNTGNPDDCPEIDRLTGSKVALFNLEVRLPLFGTEQFGLINLGFLPVDLNAFLDGGIAWNNHETPVFKLATRSQERIPVFSTGLSARINLFGYLVGEVYYAYPFQRPNKNWMFGFVLAPGW